MPFLSVTHSERDNEDREDEDRAYKLVMDDPFGVEKGSDTTIWSVNDNALRDLLVFLVRKYRIDDVYDSRIKTQNWEKLIKDFHVFTENRVTISKPQIFRKWHNWKQYNKAHKKPHPFVICGEIDDENVTKKCKELCQRAQVDPVFAALLARGMTETLEGAPDRKRTVSTDDSDSHSEASPSKKSALDPDLGRLLAKRDFIVRRTGASAAALSIRRLQHEINLENLSYEAEKWRICYETNQLMQQKIHKQLELADVKLERVQAEFNLKKNKCIDLGLIV